METSRSGLSPTARSQLAVLEEARRKWEHIQAMVEQVTARKSGQFHDAGAAAQERRVKSLMDQIRRSAADVEQLLAERKFSGLAGEVGQLIVLARPGASANRASLAGMREVTKTVLNGIEAAEAEVRRKDRESTAQ
ncbi:MAG: hypothetical protein PVH40_03495 [Gemmatimonadales bacterium]|jgi:hypothetical protein